MSTKMALHIGAPPPHIDGDFLYTLRKAARTYGHEGDYQAVVDFVNWCHRSIGIMEMPPLEPYEDEPKRRTAAPRQRTVSTKTWGEMTPEEKKAFYRQGG